MHQLALYVRETLLESDSLRARLARGMAWLLASSATSQVATLLASIFAARLLGPTAFGELGVIRSTVLMLGTLAGAGLGLAATKCVAEFRDTAPDRAGRVIGLLLNVAMAISAVVAILCFLLAEPLAHGLLGQDSLSKSLRMSCVLIVINTLNGVLIGAISGLEAFRAVAALSLLESILNVLLISLGAWADGLAGAVTGIIAVSVIVFISRLAALHRECGRWQIRIRHREVSSELTLLGRFALPVILVQMGVQPFEWLSRILFARQTGLDELGIFTAAFSLGQIVSFLPQQVVGASSPVLANQYAAGNLRLFRKIVRTSLLTALGLGLLTAIPIMCGSSWLMAAYGPRFASGAWSLVLLLAGYALFSGTLVLKSALIASGLVWAQVRHSLVYGGVLVGAVLLLAPYGAKGMGLAYLVAYAALLSVQCLAAWLRGLLGNPRGCLKDRTALPA